MFSIQTILHPTDFSICSDAAFELACSLAEKYDACLILLHVFEPPIMLEGEGSLMAPIEFKLEPLHEKLRTYLQRCPIVPMETHLYQGAAAEEIVRAAAQTQCDMIVLGSHGRTGLSRLMLGSVAEKVQRQAKCAVVIVKSPAPWQL